MLPEPDLRRDDKRGLWVVDTEMRVPSRGWTLIVPAGWETDLASVPRVCWPLIDPPELSCVAAITHDRLYEHGGLIITVEKGLHRFTRADADAFLLDLMQQQGVPAWRRWSAYYAVRAFGASSWRP